MRLSALSPWTQREGVVTRSSSIAKKVFVLHYADESVKDREFDFEFDAVHSCLVRRLNLVVTGELDGEEGDVEDQDYDVDEDKVSE